MLSNTLTDRDLDLLCGTPTRTFEERMIDDARSMTLREQYTGAVS
jgi:hypothetical protein